MTCPSEPTIEAVLGRLIACGYRFVHPRDAQGHVVTVVGIRAHGTVIDVIRIDAENDVTAMRMPGDEDDVLAPRTVLWSSSGTMHAVVDDLLRLSDDAYAAVSASTSAGGCWVDNSRGDATWLMATA